MPQDEEEGGRERNPLAKFFSKIGSVFVGSEKEKDASLGGGVKADEEAQGLSQRLEELKSLEVETAERRKKLEAEEEEEEDTWEREREELQRPASERLAEIFSGIFGGIASRMTGTFSGLEEDLNRANMGYSEKQFIGLLLGVDLIATACVSVFIWFFLNSIIFTSLGGGLSFIVILLVGRNQPKSKISSRASEINQEIPYALRHMATQLSSGIGLPETMTSVSEAGYGALSEEFDRTLQQMRMGKSMTKALAELQERVGSDSLSKAVRQIQRTLKTGGNLSRTLEILADESSFDLRMKLRDYTQSLNMMTMVYMFASAIIPSLLVVIMIVSSFMGAQFLPPVLMNMLYLIVIPFLLAYLVVIFKRMEPEV